jgi:agmatine deiminase
MLNIDTTKTPKALGYHFPAEWEHHASTWLSYPHNDESWPGKIHTIFPSYHQFIKEISTGETVNINVVDETMKTHVQQALTDEGINMCQIRLHIHPTNDAWCRDHGPAFVVNPAAGNKKAIVNWKYNAWGNKYPYDLDTVIPTTIGKEMGLPVFYPGIVMEGGSVDFNGTGTLLTTTACLLHENRNLGLSQSQIEQYLCDYYGVEQILWLGDGIEGDDTNGHIDDITRFINADTVVTVTEQNKKDGNHVPLQNNLNLLKKMRLLNGKQLNIVELPMPDTIIYEDQRLPASYANFYISNHAVIVPTYQCKQDEKAIETLSQCFKDRKVIGVDAVEIIWGLGSWHCLSQQEPDI